MFDLLLQEVAKRFGLGNKVTWILSALLSRMFNRSQGGMSGFLEQLTRSGLGQTVNSWLGKGEPMEVNAAQVESAMGSGVINNLASKLDLASGPVGMAVAHMLPEVVSGLTLDGVIPDNIPANVAHYIKDDDLAVTTRTAARTQPQRNDYNVVSESTREGSGFSWWWLLLPLFLLLGWYTLKQSEQTPVSTVSQTPAVVTEPEVPETPIPSIKPSLSISNEADRFNVSGTVADDATKESIFGMLISVAGSDKVSGDIGVDPATRNAGWLATLSAILPALKDVPGATLRLDGDDIILGGNLEQDKIDGLMGELNGVFGAGYNISSQAVGLAPSSQVPDRASESIDAEPIDTTQAVLNDAGKTGVNTTQDSITSSAVRGEDLVNALNMTGINFASGSFNITPESMAVLSHAARAIKAAPADTRIRVGGHTDNTGSSQINTKLSGQRAQAVADALVGMGVDASMLTAKGFGDSQPVADNSSEEGRALNRRMEFTLQ